jgi:hypothetical protein
MQMFDQAGHDLFEAHILCAGYGSDHGFGKILFGQISHGVPLDCHCEEGVFPDDCERREAAVL